MQRVHMDIRAASWAGEVSPGGRPLAVAGCAGFVTAARSSFRSTIVQLCSIGNMLR
jgi:hypothetical protein